MGERNEFITLYELNSHVRRLIETEFSGSFWVQAELSDVREAKTGHCYLEFIQKGAGDVCIARSSGVAWRNYWEVISPYFQTVTGASLSAGMQVLVKVKVSFNEYYGYQLSVEDIDPTFTVGDLARKRREILQKLEQAGILNMNKELPLPRLLKRIAVISSATAAGWGDFQHQLVTNQYGFAFKLGLFEATMQGADVGRSVISALERIAGEIDKWDVVVIIRGGGAVTDLLGFDSLELAENVAQFPIPVITGIGHERDETVIDIISHTKVKTPTAVAELILAHQLNELESITLFADRLERGARSYLVEANARLDKHLYALRVMVPAFIERRRHRLELIERTLDGARPEHLLRLGYGIVRQDGKALKEPSLIQNGSKLEITLEGGTTSIIVDKVIDDN